MVIPFITRCLAGLSGPTYSAASSSSFLGAKELMTEGGCPLIYRTDMESGYQNKNNLCKACFLDNGNQSTLCVGSCISAFVRGRCGARSAAAAAASEFHGLDFFLRGPTWFLVLVLTVGCDVT